MVFISRFIEQSHWEKRLITLVLFLLPWQTRWVWLPLGSPEYWDPYRTFSWYMSALPVLILLGFFLRRILLDWGVRDIVKGKLPLVHRLWIVLIGFALLGAGVSVDGATSFFFVSQLLVTLVGALLLMFYAHTRVIDMAFFVSRLTSSLALVALLALAQFFTQSIPASTLLGIAPQSPATGGASVLEIAGARIIRAHGSFGHPNILGGYMVAGVLILMQSWFSKVRMPPVWGGAWILMMGALFVSFSRSAGLALLLGMLVLSWQYRRRMMMWWAAVGLVVVALSVLFMPLVQLRIEGQGRLEVRALSERVDGIREAVQFIPHIPVLGVGPGAYTSIIARIDPSRSAWSYQPPHNIPLLVLVELGYGGLFLLVVWWVMLARRNAMIAYSLFPLALFDHYLWTLWSGMVLVMIWMVWAYLVPPRINRNVDIPS